VTPQVAEAIRITIAELESQRSEALRSIFALRRLIGEPVNESTEAAPTEAPKAKPAPQPQPVAPKPAAKAKPTTTVPANGSRLRANMSRVLAVLRAAGKPIAARDVHDKLGDLSRNDVGSALKALRDDDLAQVRGSTAAARWNAVFTTPEQQPEFETVWAGRKTDPSLTGDRPTRAC
jgi:hypothetical protein